MSNSPSEIEHNRLVLILEQLSLFFSRHGGVDIYIAGGTVRDWLLGRKITDLDLVMSKNAMLLARAFASETGGAFVPLDENEDVARVIMPENGFIVDFSSFRKTSASLEQDLLLRDFTINSMAVSLQNACAAFLSETTQINLLDIVDPSNGRLDLANASIRSLAVHAFEDDPLRAIRAYRFAAQLGFMIEADTQKWISNTLYLVDRVSQERISHELDLIMATDRAADTFKQMMAAGLLFRLLPEVKAMDGVEQPGFHHLDVLGHSLEALYCSERLIMNPESVFPEAGPFESWLSGDEKRKVALKWAAFFHDIAKPACKSDKNGRATFYQHDRQGAEFVKKIATRLRWSNKTGDFVAKLVMLHMRPFHLLNDLRKNGPSRRAMRRLALELAEDLPALFLLTMADTMAGCGPLKPENLEAEIIELWRRLYFFYKEEFLPIKQKRRLIDGLEVQIILNIGPGPVIGKAIDAVEEAQLDGVFTTKEEAVEWLAIWWQGYCAEKC